MKKAPGNKQKGKKNKRVEKMPFRLVRGPNMLTHKDRQRAFIMAGLRSMGAPLAPWLCLHFVHWFV